MYGRVQEQFEMESDTSYEFLHALFLVLQFTQQLYHRIESMLINNTENEG